jgi:tRNA pseudouridine55 synthase
MGRRKKGKAVHGWIALDKPAGMTSTQAVGAVRRIFDANKAGHAGTLDPLATGMLPIALGEATKTVPYAVAGEKRYRFSVRWGTETDTDDAQGCAVKSSDLRPGPTDIEALLAGFTGDILQVPPAFSAIKVAGERAYDLAREGEAVVLAARSVHIDSLDLVEVPDPATAVFEAACGKGTYVRAVARDLGRALGCYGHVIALRRTSVANFTQAQAITLEELRAAEAAGLEALQHCLLPIAAALSELVQFSVGQNDAARLLRGQRVLIRGRDAPMTGGATYATCQGHLIAIGHIERGELTPTRVFNFSDGG